MMKRAMWVAAGAVAVTMMTAPAMATYGKSYGGFYCGGKDANGCSVSPVKKNACVKDLKGDIRELKCDLVELIVDILLGKNPKSIYYDVKEIKADLKEISFDLSILKGLKK